MRTIDMDENNVKIESFPTKISSYPVYINNKFTRNIQTSSIEFSNFGDSFTFKWLPNLKTGTGLIKANTSTLIGNILFDPQFICIPFCYTGLEPRKHASIIDRSSLYIENLQDINLNTEKSQIYDLWLKTFSLNKILSVKNNKNENVNAYEVDTFLFTLLKEHWSLLTKNKSVFISSMRLLLGQKNKEQTEKFSYRFPIEIQFEWPKFINNKDTVQTNSLTPILFPLTQVHSGVHTQKVTLSNPSNQSVLLQVLLASNYTQRNNLFELIQSESALFYDFKYQHIMESLLKSEKSVKSDSVEKNSFFRLNLDLNKKMKFMAQEFKQLNTEPNNKDTFIFLLGPNEQKTVQIEFHPEKIGKFEDMLIIRNNLTIIDVQLVSGQVGTAELRVNNLPPEKSSLFFNEIQQSSGTFQTVDFSNIILQMNKDDFEHCNSPKDSNTQDNNNLDFNNDRFLYSTLLDQYSHILNKLYLDDMKTPDIKIENNTREGIEVIYMSQQLLYFSKSSFKSKNGIVLRGYLMLKNIGNTHLNVMNVIFDGDSCFSRGIEVTYCNPFTIIPFDSKIPLNESVYLLEIRYRPDFTMANIKKSLVLETNIGDLRYTVEVQIPHYMLSICHDSLPRPPVEGYLFYMGICLVFLLVLVMFLTSMVEARSIIKYQYEIYEQMYSMNETKNWFTTNSSDTTNSNNYTHFVDVNTKEYQIPATKNKLKSNKTQNQLNLKKNKQNSDSPSNLSSSSHSNRCLTKSFSNPRNANPGSDSSVSSTCSLSSNNVTHSIKKASSSPKAEKALKQRSDFCNPLPISAMKNNNNNTEIVNDTSIPIVQQTNSASAVLEPDILNLNNNTNTNQLKNIPLNNMNKTVQKSNNKNNNRIENGVGNNINIPILSNNVTKKVAVVNNSAIPSINNKSSTAASIQNENLAVQRKNYLNQQKSQLKNSKSLTNDVTLKTQQMSTNDQKKLNVNGIHQIQNLKIKQGNSDKTQRNTTAQSLANKVNASNTLSSGDNNDIKQSNNETASTILSTNLAYNKLNTQNQLEKLEIELLNTQLQQLQQENKQQLQELSFNLNGQVNIVTSPGSNNLNDTNSESSSSPSPNSSSSSSSSQAMNKRILNEQKMKLHQCTQNDLIDIILNSSRLDKDKNSSNSSVQPKKCFVEDLLFSGKPFKITENEIESFEDYQIGLNNESSLENSDSLSSSPLSDSWIMADLSGSNFEDDYEKIVQETEDFKQSYIEIQQNQQNPGSQLTELAKNSNLDKILYSLINQSEDRNQTNNISDSQVKPAHPTLKTSLSAGEYPTYNSKSNNQNTGFLGPIQRPRTLLNNAVSNSHGLDFSQGLNLFDPDLKIDNNQYSLGSNLKLTSEDIAILSALFSAKTQEIAYKTKLKASADFNTAAPKLQESLCKTKTSNDDDIFHEFRLFENDNSLTNHPKSNLLLENNYNNIPTSSAASYWPLTSSLNGPKGNSEGGGSGAPWNSVLLNDFDDFAAPSSLNNSSTGNHIKSLWATSLKMENSSAVSGEKSSANSSEKVQTKNVLKNKKK